MNRVVRIMNDGSRHAGTAWRAAQSQPGWLARVIAVVLILILIVPIVILTVLAVLLVAIAFGILAVAHRIRRWFRSLLPRDDGRQNVRVIRRDGPSSTPN